MTRDNLIVPILEGEEENVTVAAAPNTATGIPQGESEAWKPVRLGYESKKLSRIVYANPLFCCTNQYKFF